MTRSSNRTWLARSSLLALIALAWVSPGRAVEVEHPFRFGFSGALMPDVNENDARAAMKVWAKTLVAEGTVQGDPNLLFCQKLADLEAALTNCAVDGVAMSTREFATLRPRVKFNRFVLGTFGGSIYEEYLLLVHAGSGITNLASLRGHPLLLLRHAKMCLALPWLDTLLLERNLPPSRDFFASIAEETTANKTVLPVFFRKAEVCLITRRTFQTMCELNPQLGRNLQVLDVSPAFVTGGVFFREGYPARQQDQIVAELTAVRKSPAGNQVLTVFQSEGLDEHPASAFDSALALLAHRRQLLAAPATNEPVRRLESEDLE